MIYRSRLSRRDLLRTSCTTMLGASAGLPLINAFAQSNQTPLQGEYLVRNAFVVTMDSAIGDIEAGDVHIRDGRIVGVGQALSAPAAVLIDGTDMIALPGLIETHWHLWTTMLRSMAGDVPERGYFPTSRGVGAFYEVDDMYHSARLGLAEALNGGITFVHDWCHNVRSPAYARAAIRALDESGIRARFSYGSPAGLPGDQRLDFDDIEGLVNDWSTVSSDDRLDLGIAWRGAGTAASQEDYRDAVGLGLPLSVHVNNYQSNAGGIAAIDAAGMLRADMQLIHAIWSSPEEVAAAARAGAALSLSPYTELRIGFGFPMTKAYRDAGVAIGLSVDTPTLSGNADMFAIMKVIQNVANAQALDEFSITARQVLEMATIEGARSMGIDDKVGSLTVGKRADMILINTRQPNLAVMTDPAHLLVEAAQPANVDTVFVDGRIRKQGGLLTSLDTNEVIDNARGALAGALQRADW